MSMASTWSLAEGPSATGQSKPTASLLQTNRVVLGGILVSLLWKIKYFAIGFWVYFEYPLTDPFFPWPFQQVGVSLGAYLLAVGACLWALRSVSMTSGLMGAALLSFSLFLLCIHQHTYNDATFLTCFWTSIWCLWFTWRLPQDAPTELWEKGTFLSHLILSLVFLGGAVGKLTPGYWSGQVLYEIYFADRDFWLFNALRGMAGDSELRDLARWYSRFVIGTEMLCSLIWLMPARWGSWLAVLTCCGIALMSNFLLFSVLTCLIALSLVGLHQLPESERGMIRA